MNCKNNLLFTLILFILSVFMVCNKTSNTINPSKNNDNVDSIALREYCIDKNNKFIKTNKCNKMGIVLASGQREYFCFVFPDVLKKRHYQFGFHFYSNSRLKSLYFDSEEEYDLAYLSKFQFQINKIVYEIKVYSKPKMSVIKTDSNYPSLIYTNNKLGLIAIRTRHKLSFVEYNSLAKDYSQIRNFMFEKIIAERNNVFE